MKFYGQTPIPHPPIHPLTSSDYVTSPHLHQINQNIPLTYRIDLQITLPKLPGFSNEMCMVWWKFSEGIENDTSLQQN